MGYVKHEVVVVTGHASKIDVLEEGLKAYKHYNGQVVVTPEMVNGVKTLLVGSEGSKEGWDSSDEGDKLRTKAVMLCEGINAEKGYRALTYAVAIVGGDDGVVRVTDHNGDHRCSAVGASREGKYAAGWSDGSDEDI